MQQLQTEVLVVGGGTGGTAAAIQAARRGAQTILVSEFSWLGGMLTAAGVSAPDGNELAALQTGLWGAFLHELDRRQAGGLDHAWVSFFTYEPRVGAEIFADWVRSLPNLHWIQGQVPLAAYKQGDRITQVRFADYAIDAQIILDATELGDLLALADVPHRWGWEWQTDFGEPSAPIAPNELTQKYPVQSPTWVVVLKDFEADAPEISQPPLDRPEQFAGAWQGYEPEAFLNYGRLPGNRFMINWPQQGNDYGARLDRLIESATTRRELLQEACWHSQSFARHIQSQLGCRYGLAETTFPAAELGGGAFALHPYYRESRRLQGMVTMREQDILPLSGGRVAALPIENQQVSAITIGNYANDHHYPGFDLPLQPKSMRWGGRWTGTPFALPYGCLVPATVDGLLVCDKNISVSHIANGATRLQPVVLGLGQAAGMAAAMCIEQQCQPRDLPMRSLQEALLQDAIAPAAVVPLLNLPPQHPDWLDWQRHYLDAPDRYPLDGNCPAASLTPPSTAPTIAGWFEPHGDQDYRFTLPDRTMLQVVTLQSAVDRQLQQQPAGRLQVRGRVNRSGNWLLVEQMDEKL